MAWWVILGLGGVKVGINVVGGVLSLGGMMVGICVVGVSLSLGRIEIVLNGVVFVLHVVVLILGQSGVRLRVKIRWAARTSTPCAQSRGKQVSYVKGCQNQVVSRY